MKMRLLLSFLFCAWSAVATVGCADDEGSQAQIQDVTQRTDFVYRAAQYWETSGLTVELLVNGRAILTHAGSPESHEQTMSAVEAINAAIYDPERMVVLPTDDNWPEREDGDYRLVLADGEQLIASSAPMPRPEAERLRQGIIDDYRAPDVTYDLWYDGPCGYEIFGHDGEFRAGRMDAAGNVSFFSPASSTPAGAREWAAAAAAAAAEPWNWTTQEYDDGYRAVLVAQGTVVMLSVTAYAKRHQAQDAVAFMVCF